MPGLLIKDLPPDVHDWLRLEARAHRRSMTQQAIVLFEERMRKFQPIRLGAPVRTRRPLSADFIARARKSGRP